MAEIKSSVPHEFKLSETGDVVVAFAQTDAVDGDQDYTYAGAFPAKNAVISDFGHTSWPERGGRLPTGKGSVKEHGGFAVLEGRFAMETDQGRNAYHTVKFMGEDQRWSYGYDVLEKAAPPPGVKAKRGLKLLDVHEVSPVLLAAGLTTHTMGLKERDGLYIPLDADDYESLKFNQNHGNDGRFSSGGGGGGGAESYAGGSVTAGAPMKRDGNVDDDAFDNAAGAKVGDRVNVSYSSSSNVGDRPTVIRDGAVTKAYAENTSADLDAGRDNTNITVRAAGKNYNIAPADVLSFQVTGKIKSRNLQFVEMSEALLADAEAFVARAAAIQDIRVKEGRALSAARRALLEEHHSGLLATASVIRELLDATAPKANELAPAASGKARAARAAALLAEAETLSAYRN